MTQFNLSTLAEDQSSWKVIATTVKTQLAMMTLQEGEQNGDYGTSHPNADQILLCLKGSGTAVVEGKEFSFKEGDLIVIAAGEKHQIKGGPCTTVNVYGPPAF